jgi:hypothetical protein
VSVRFAVALCAAAASTTLTNLAYLREHDAAAALPELSLRRPLHSAGMLLGDRAWLTAFAMESSGFLLYALAVGLASLAVVQSIGAGGIGVLGFIGARMAGRRLGHRERAGLLCSVAGLAALGVSLSRATGQGAGGSTAGVLAWLAVSVAAGLLALAVGRRRGSVALSGGIAGGLFFSVGDFSTKLATQGGVRSAFVLTLILGYAFGTSLLQLAYQRGGALTVAGVATLLTNAVPIAGGTVVLGEPVPAGLLGVLRVAAFVAVTVGAILLARPDRQAVRRAGGRC